MHTILKRKVWYTERSAITALLHQPLNFRTFIGRNAPQWCTIMRRLHCEELATRKTMARPGSNQKQNCSTSGCVRKLTAGHDHHTFLMTNITEVLTENWRNLALEEISAVCSRSALDVEHEPYREHNSQHFQILLQPAPLTAKKGVLDYWVTLARPAVLNCRSRQYQARSQRDANQLWLL